MNDTGIHLPPLGNCSIRLRYREIEAATQRQSKTLKKLTCDKINAMCEIEALKMRVDATEENAREYRRQLDDMASAIKSVKEKHRDEVETLKAHQLKLEKQVAIVKRHNKTQKELISNLTLENEMLKRKLTSSWQKSDGLKTRSQALLGQSYKTVKRSASRCSSSREFLRS